MPETMFKKEIVSKIAAREEITKKEATRFLQAFIAVVGDELEQGNDVKLCGFFNFFVKHLPEKSGVHPQTGKPIKIPAVRTIHTRMSKALKRRIKL